MIVSRGMQGAASAIVVTSSAAMIMDMTPREEWGFALGINQIAARLGAVAGLTVSGTILSFLDWRFLFYINIPVGVFGTLLGPFGGRGTSPSQGRVAIDWVGFACFTVSMTAVLLLLTFSAYGTPGGEPLLSSLSATAAVSFGVFIFNGTRAHIPSSTSACFEQSKSAAAWSPCSSNGTAFGGVVLVMSLYFQLVAGFNPPQAGLAILPVDVGVMFLGPIRREAFGPVRPSPFTSSGLALSSLSLVVLSGATSSTPYAEVAVFLALLGAGFGLFMSPNTSAIMTEIPETERGMAAGIRSTFLNVGNALSQNLVILIMVSTLPYAVVGAVISSGGAASSSQAQIGQFAQGIRDVLLFLGLSRQSR